MVRSIAIPPKEPSLEFSRHPSHSAPFYLIIGLLTPNPGPTLASARNTFHYARGDLFDRALRMSNRKLQKGLGLLLCLIVAALPAVAGGSWERVHIDEIAINGVDYTLVVSRVASASIDPYFRGCKRFEVHGTYRWLKGTIFHQEAGLSRDDHVRALEFLRQASETKQQVDFGWIGVGFVPIEPAKPCVVRSRALQLFQDEQGSHVLSYHTSTSARSD